MPHADAWALSSDLRVLIVGVSTRAAAESAGRAGFDVIALDAYADLDQHPSVRALSLPRDFGQAFSPEAIAAAATELSSDAVVYLSNLENHPEVVDVLATGRALWGNGSEILRRVRDPQSLAHAFVERGIRAPRVLTPGQNTEEQHSDVARWLIKPRVSGGGHGVRIRSASEPVTRGHYLQEFIDGIPGSVVFVAAEGRGVALGTSRQLVGESVFGASGFRYCGNILIPHVTEVVAGALRRARGRRLRDLSSRWCRQHRLRHHRPWNSSRRSQPTLVRVDGAGRPCTRRFTVQSSR